ncbi:MAG TPA: hypothetical protein PKN52_12325, partial [Trueperaceae bacterium]|nr:hypothetical protein [Trueperaceae bacterium]
MEDEGDVDYVDENILAAIDKQIAANKRLDETTDEYTATLDAYSDLLSLCETSEQLEDTFLAIKHHPGWAELDSEGQTEVTQNFISYMDSIARGDPRYSRASGPKAREPMASEVFRELIENANRTLPAGSPQVVGVDTVAEFEAATGHAAPSDARGVFVDGSIYMVRENLGDPKDFVFVLAHERGHHGLDTLLGDRLPAVVNRLWTNAATRDRIKARMKLLNESPEVGSLRRAAAEEVLMDMLAGGERVNGDVLAKVRSAIDNAFAHLLGVSHLRMTNAEVDALLRDVALAANGRTPKGSGKAPHLQGLEFALEDPAQFVAGDPKFS